MAKKGFFARNIIVTNCLKSQRIPALLISNLFQIMNSLAMTARRRHRLLSAKLGRYRKFNKLAHCAHPFLTRLGPATPGSPVTN